MDRDELQKKIAEWLDAQDFTDTAELVDGEILVSTYDGLDYAVLVEGI